MADIFDLARSINAQKQQASQGYGSALEDLPMQVMEIMDTRAKEKRVSLKNDSVLLSNLIKGATTEEEMANAKQLASKYAKDSYKHDETKLYGEAINQQFNSKQAAYNQFKSSAEWFDNQINTKTSEMNVVDSVFKFESSDRAIRHNNKGAHIWTPNVEEKYGATKGDSFVGADGETYYTAKYDSKEKGDKASRSIINNMWERAGGDVDKFVRAYTGSDDEEVIANYKKEIESSKAKGGSYFKMSSQEMQELSLGDIEERIREFENISGGFEAGQQFGFKYNKGKSSYVTLQNEYADYKQRLDDTMKAHVTGDKISGEEAMAIMLGDFDNTKKQAITQTNANIAQGLKEYNALLTLQRKQLTADDVDSFVSLYPEAEGMSVDAVKDYINKKLPVVLNSIDNSKERLRLWTGLDTKAGKSDFYSSSTDGNNVNNQSNNLDNNKKDEIKPSQNISESWLNNVYDMAYSKIGLSKKETEILLANYNATHNNEITKGSTPSDQTLLNYFRKNQSSLDPPKQIEPVKGYDTQSEIEEYWNENVSIPEAKQSGLPSIGVQNQGGGKFKFMQVKDGKWEIYKGKTASMNGVKVPIKTVNGKKYYYDYKKKVWK